MANSCTYLCTYWGYYLQQPCLCLVLLCKEPFFSKPKVVTYINTEKIKVAFAVSYLFEHIKISQNNWKD